MACSPPGRAFNHLEEKSPPRSRPTMHHRYRRRSRVDLRSRKAKPLTNERSETNKSFASSQTYLENRSRLSGSNLRPRPEALPRSTRPCGNRWAPPNAGATTSFTQPRCWNPRRTDEPDQQIELPSTPGKPPVVSCRLPCDLEYD